MTEPMESARRPRGRLLDVPGAADYLGTSERHIRRLVEERRVPYCKLGPGRSARLRFDSARLDDWLDQHTVEPEQSFQPQPEGTGR
jgi:excisionase family DNA binding protein